MTELWCVRWTRPLTAGEEEKLTALLPPQRRERLAKTEEARTQALCAYDLLRLALGEERLPAIALGERGKPFFTERPDLHFSLSHTEGAALVGLSDRPIGVDIEKLRPLPPRVQAAFGGDIWRWTALEARAKRSGRGVGEFLHKIEEGPGAVALDVGEGYAASAACEGPVSLRFCALEDILPI